MSVQRIDEDDDADREEQTRGDMPAALRDGFLDELSGDMRHSLESILDCCKLLRDGKPDAERRRRAMASIERTAAAAITLLEETSDLRALAAGRTQRLRDAVEVRSLLERSIEACAAPAAARRIKVSLDVGRDVDSTTGDGERLQHVFERLLRETLRLALPGASVVVRAARLASDVEVVLSTQDRPSQERTSRGRGGQESPRSKAKVADPEVDAIVPLGPAGLSLLQRVLELHGGALAGTRGGAPSRVRLPARVAQPPASGDVAVNGRVVASPRRASMARPLEGVRVLVVDDETDARDLAAMVLAQAGAEVHEASSASEALRILTRHRPDVVVSDIGMPGQDGHSLIRSIRDLPAPLGGIRAMAVTAFARSEDRHRSLDAGFDMHVVKPVDPMNLVGSVARLVGRDPTVAA